MTRTPRVVVLAGPNGAGKSTSAPFLLRDTLAVDEFVNADTIAAGLSGFSPERAAIGAGRAMLQRLHSLADARADFAFETTLATRHLALWLSELTTRAGYDFYLVYLWLPSPEAAINRVHQRVRQGGHDVPEETIRRRYTAGLKNLKHYSLLARNWSTYDSSHLPPALVVKGEKERVVHLADEATWSLVREYFQHA